MASALAPRVRQRFCGCRCEDFGVGNIRLRTPSSEPLLYISLRGVQSSCEDDPEDYRLSLAATTSVSEHTREASAKRVTEEEHKGEQNEQPKAEARAEHESEGEMEQEQGVDQAQGGTKRTSDSSAAPLRDGQATPSPGVQLKISAYPTSLHTNIDTPNHLIAPSNFRIPSKPGKSSKPGKIPGEGQEVSTKPPKRAKAIAKPATAYERQQEEINTAKGAFTTKWAEGKKPTCDWSLLTQYV